MTGRATIEQSFSELTPLESAAVGAAGASFAAGAAIYLLQVPKWSPFVVGSAALFFGLLCAYTRQGGASA